MTESLSVFHFECTSGKNRASTGEHRTRNNAEFNNAYSCPNIKLVRENAMSRTFITYRRYAYKIFNGKPRGKTLLLICKYKRVEFNGGRVCTLMTGLKIICKEICTQRCTILLHCWLQQIYYINIYNYGGIYNTLMANH